MSKSISSYHLWATTSDLNNEHCYTLDMVISSYINCVMHLSICSMKMSILVLCAINNTLNRYLNRSTRQSSICFKKISVYQDRDLNNSLSPSQVDIWDPFGNFATQIILVFCNPSLVSLFTKLIQKISSFLRQSIELISALILSTEKYVSIKTLF